MNFQPHRTRIDPQAPAAVPLDVKARQGARESTSVRPALHPLTDVLGRPLARGSAELTPGGPLSSVMRVLRRRAWIVIACAVVAAVATFAIESTKPKEYSASAQLLFRDPGLSSELFGGGSVFAPSSDPTRAAATNLMLVTSDGVAAQTAKELGGGLTAEKVSEDVSAESDGNSDLVTITATDTDRQRAARIANTYARTFITTRQTADRNKVLQARDLLLRQLTALPDQSGTQADNLRQRADQLLTLAALQTGNAELVQSATVPTSASGPRVKRNTVLGLILGFLVGVGIALLLDVLDRRLKSVEDIEDVLEAPVLGSVPESRAVAHSVGVDGAGHRADLEPFDMVRTNLRYLKVERPIRSVLVTSAQPGDGKTTVAWNLAVAAARSGTKALLVEADLRRPRVADGAQFSQDVGLSSVIAGMTGLDDAIVRFSAFEDTPDAILDVIPAGPVPPNPVGLLESTRMRALLEEAGRHYELIVIDTPPVSAAADAIPLTQDVDGVLAVVRLGSTRRDTLLSLRSQFANVGAPLLGIVVNGAKVPTAYLGAYRTYA